jgi:hypothetical protein
MKNILQRFTNRKKSCAKVLNYFASPSNKKKASCLHGKKKRTKMANERIILGIDPGTTIMGFGLIRVINKNGVLQLNELQLSKYDNHYQKLKLIFERTIELIPIIQTRLPLKRLSLGKMCSRC